MLSSDTNLVLVIIITILPISPNGSFQIAVNHPVYGITNHVGIVAIYAATLAPQVHADLS